MKITRCFFMICGLLLLTACTVVQGVRLAPGGQAAAASQPGAMITTPAETPQFIEFFSPLWSTCREVLPIVNGLEKDYAGRITFRRVNVHDPKSKTLMDTYGVTSTPELYLVNGQGRVIGSWDGSVSQKELQQAFDRALERSGN